MRDSKLIEMFHVKHISNGKLPQGSFLFIRFYYRFLEYLKTQMDFPGVENVLCSQ